MLAHAFEDEHTSKCDISLINVYSRVINELDCFHAMRFMVCVGVCVAAASSV